MKERWRWVRKYKGYYKVSTLGRVKSVERMSYSGKRKPYRVPERILKTSPFSKDFPYPIVNLTKEGKQKTFAVHDLVLDTFVGPRPKGMVARHFPDRDPTNCKATNLGWATPKENQADRKIHGTEVKGDKHPNCKVTSKQIRKLKRMRKEGYRVDYLADLFNLSLGWISKILNDKERKEGK